MISTFYLGLIFAFVSALCTAAVAAVISRQVIRAQPSNLAFFTVLIGLVISGSLTFFFPSSALVSLVKTPGILIIVLLLVVSGMLQYGVSRFIYYTAIRNLGANITGPINSVITVTAAVALAMFLLHEKLTEIVGAGLILIPIGIFLLETRKIAAVRSGNPRLGYSAAVISGIIPAFTSVVLSYTLSVYGYIFMSVFISFVAASFFHLLNTRIRKDSFYSFLHFTQKRNLLWISIAGILAVTSQLFRYGALLYTPVVIVVPIFTSSNLFIPLFTWLIAREIEIFNARAILGIVIITIGLVLVAMY